MDGYARLSVYEDAFSGCRLYTFIPDLIVVVGTFFFFHGGVMDGWHGGYGMYDEI
jgi:hypothetical protein